MLRSAGQNEKWTCSGPGGYIILAIYRFPNASVRGTKHVVAHKWAWWLHNTRRMGGNQHFKGGDKIRSGPLLS